MTFTLPADIFASFVSLELPSLLLGSSIYSLPLATHARCTPCSQHCDMGDGESVSYVKCTKKLYPCILVAAETHCIE